MKIAISGASGFIGNQLSTAFNLRKDNVIALTREDFHQGERHLATRLNDCSAVINLAGETINRRWSRQHMQAIYDSRIATTKLLVAAMGRLNKPPECFISTSGIGIFEQQGAFTEDDTPAATDFMGKLARDWEAQALAAAPLGVRTLIFRFPLVLGRTGGIMKRVLPLFRLGLGGTIGDGRQHFSWVHIDDLVSAYVFALEHEEMRGVYHPCAPNPVTNRMFTKKLGQLLKRPAVLPIPHFVLKLAFGQGAQVMVSGQQVTSKRLPKAGFKFQYEAIDQALSDIIRRPALTSNKNR